VERVKRVTRIIAIGLFIVFASGIVGACSLMSGYFHQVTAIRGRVVGRDLGPLQFRWLRQSFSVGDATLTLYEYRSPARVENLRKVAVITTDGRGNFDFGAIPKGHYSLSIDVKDHRMGAWFDVEVTDTVKPTKDIVVDVSPIAPNCQGGHEFIESKKS
jgi:hypothetical protein